MITRYGGVGYCGQLGAGNISVDGEVRNFALAAGSASTVRGTFLFDHPNGIANHRFIIYHNRKPMCETVPELGFESAPLAAGSHEFDVLRIRSTSRGVPDYYGELWNRRPYLRWSAAPENDCRGYNIYWDAGTGTVDYNTAYGTVIGTAIQQLRDAAPTTGTGSGRITVSGNYDGDPQNALWYIEITADGKWQYSTGGALDGTDKDIFRGVIYTLPNGVSLSFQDAAASYSVGDKWSFRVGPATEWVGPSALDDGTYLFTVAPYDAAGNVGTPCADETIIIAGKPDPAENLSLSTKNLGNGITVTFDALPAGSALNVYSNYNAIFGDWEDYVEERGPHGTFSAVDELEFDSVPGRNVKLFARVIDSGGVEEDNSTLWSLEVYAEGDEPSSLRAPTLESVTPAAGGLLQIRAYIDVTDGIPATIAIYSGTGATWDDLTLLDSEAFTPDGSAVQEWTYTTGILGVTTYFGLKAIDSDGLYTGGSDVLGGTPDATAPSAITISRSMPT